jgi:hypothetical protein
VNEALSVIGPPIFSDPHIARGSAFRLLPR